MEYEMLLPPKSVRGMVELDRTKFDKTTKIPHLQMENVNTASVLPYVKKYLLKMENLKPISNLENTEEKVKLALLNPCKIKSWFDIEYSDRENLIILGVSEKNFKMKDFTLHYENWKADEILKAVLPADQESLTSFSKIGHIVHVNLKNHLLPYKKLIGEVLLNKVKACRTVVNKIETIDSTFRFFKMEVLCGDVNMQCQVKENHCRFDFDFSKVYWNPRLCTEHERITNLIKEGDVLYDIFAGVGPFAIPAAKKKAYVFANDLNPDCYKWLNHNAKTNKINGSFLSTFNKDGREFILNEFKSDLVKKMQCTDVTNKIHVTMNLPALAVEFLDAFCGLYDSKSVDFNSALNYPVVHVYCFANSQKNAKQMIEAKLGFKLEICDVFNVRNISPKKDMIRVSFKLNSDILCCKSEKELLLEKKRKLVSEEILKIKKCCHGEKKEQVEGNQQCVQSGGCPESQGEGEGEAGQC